MGDHAKVIVYVKASDARALRAAGEDPGEWVRGVVKSALRVRRGQISEVELPGVTSAQAAEAMKALVEAAPSAAQVIRSPSDVPAAIEGLHHRDHRDELPFKPDFKAPATKKGRR